MSKPKRSIMGGDAPSYRGVDQIQGYYDAADQVMMRKVGGVMAVQACPYPEDSKRFFLTLWISACRKGESVMLHPDQWKWNSEAIRGVKLPVLKKRERVYGLDGKPVYREEVIPVMQQDGSIQSQKIFRPMSKRKIEYRDHLIPRDIPLGEKFIDMVHNLNTEGYKYILFKRERFTRKPDKTKATSVRSVNDRIDELHSELFPHGIRALHVRFMRDKFGQAFDTPELKEHLKWSSEGMAVYYLSGQKLANAMGIKRLPS